MADCMNCQHLNHEIWHVGIQPSRWSAEFIDPNLDGSSPMIPIQYHWGGQMNIPDYQHRENQGMPRRTDGYSNWPPRGPHEFPMVCQILSMNPDKPKRNKRRRDAYSQAQARKRHDGLGGHVRIVRAPSRRCPMQSLNFAQTDRWKTGSNVWSLYDWGHAMWPQCGLWIVIDFWSTATCDECPQNSKVLLPLRPALMGRMFNCWLRCCCSFDGLMAQTQVLSTPD